MKKPIGLIVLIVILLFLVATVMNVAKGRTDVSKDIETPKTVTTFEECVAEGNPILESYPEQCRAKDGTLFVRNIGNILEKQDLIRLSFPRPGDVISSPIEIRGEARGYWFFEATFPVVITDWNGLIIAEGYAEAGESWMTEDFVPFTVKLTFAKPTLYPERGTLILHKSNASGLPEHDDALEIPVSFK